MERDGFAEWVCELQQRRRHSGCVVGDYERCVLRYFECGYVVVVRSRGTRWTRRKMYGDSIAI